MAEVRLSAAARRDLLDIRLTGMREHGDAVSAAYLLGFDRRFELLRRQPFAGQERPEFRRAMRSLSCHPHRILYRVVGDVVIVDRIVHHARDLQRVFRKSH